MPEETNTDTSAQTGNATGEQAGAGATGKQETGAGTGAATGGDATQAEKTFTQADIDRIIRERLADEQKRAAKKAADEAAKARGDFEAVAKSEKERADAAEARAVAAELKATLVAMGAKYGLTERQASRLQGATAEEIEADAKAEAAENKAILDKAKPRGSGADGAAGNNTDTSGGSVMENIRRRAGVR